MMSTGMMFVSMFLIQYVFMGPIMTNSLGNITNSLGKVYMSTMMGLFMVVAGVLTHHHFNLSQFLLYGGLLGLCIFLYKIQFGINDKEYLKEMIEHHSMALLTSQAILQKTDKSAVADIAQRIIHTQEKEINEMKELLRLE